MSAASIAISVPVPSAMPTSACASAGASLIPSPTMATVFPSDWSRRIRSAFPAGRTPARTFSIPARDAIARAVVSLSPVSIMTSIPICRSSPTAPAEVGLILSATAMIPATALSIATRRRAFPSPVSFSTDPSAPVMSTPDSFIIAAFPAATGRPSTIPVTPRPVSERKDSHRGISPGERRALSTTASARGTKR